MLHGSHLFVGDRASENALGFHVFPPEGAADAVGLEGRRGISVKGEVDAQARCLRGMRCLGETVEGKRTVPEGKIVKGGGKAFRTNEGRRL